MDGLIYVFRTGISPPLPTKGCTLDEVALAIACERSPELAVVAYRNPGYLTDPDSSQYKILFHGDRPVKAEEAWRAVRIYRQSAEYLTTIRALRAVAASK